MKKLLMLLLLVTFILIGCATEPIKYEKQSFTPPPKQEEYKLPADPFANVPAPVFIYLKKDTDGRYIVSSKEEVEVYAFTPTELQKITLRISYLKEVNTQLVDLVNIQIRRGNVLIDLFVDQQIAKELYREINVDLQNQMKHDKAWNTVEKGGLWAIIIGLIIELGIAL